jgi:hypothetical protein
LAAGVEEDGGAAEVVVEATAEVVDEVACEVVEVTA